MIQFKNKYYILFVLWTAVFSLAVTGCGGSKEESGKSAEKKLIEEQAYVSFLLGRVEIKNGGKSRKATLKDTLRAGDTLKTYKGSRAYIQIGRDRVLKVFPGTELKIDTLIRDYRTGISLKEGKVYSKITKKLKSNERYNIVTPTVVASVRGTEFMTKYHRGRSEVKVARGEIALFQQKDKPVKIEPDTKPDATIKAGDYTVVKRKKKPVTGKLSEIQKLEMEKEVSGLETIPEVDKKTVDFIKAFHNKNKKKMILEEKKINRRIIEVIKRDRPLVILVLKDGSKLKGHLLDQNEKAIKLDDGKDTLSIPKSDVIRREFTE
jgi:hypothetical protein